jgi:hypothetical protein
MPLQSPFANLYTAIMQRINTAMPAIKFISQDLGQLDLYDERPPVSWPCVLIDIGDAAFEDAGNNLQLATANVTLRLSHTTYSDISNLPNAQVRELGLKYYELEHELCSYLHGWQPVDAQGNEYDELGELCRVATATEKRDDNIRVRLITFSVAMQYDTTLINPTATPMQVVPNMLP